MESYPKLQAPNRFHLPIIRTVEIPFGSANVRMAHQSLDGTKVIPIIQKGRGEGRNKDKGEWHPFRLDCIPIRTGCQ